MSLYAPPKELHTEIFTSLPECYRRREKESEWVRANKPGQQLDGFLEGPAFDRYGNLYLTDIPYGRIFRISPDKEWSLVTEYDGWPNGIAIHRDGTLYIADYRNGIMVLDPAEAEVRPLITHVYSERFRGCNDLTFASNGDLYFTDQGQSGLHMPNGRVFRYTADGQLECLIDTCPSPNGLVFNKTESLLYVAMTRGNSIWRLPLMVDGGISKVGLFIQLSGGRSGPDGMALDQDDQLVVAHAGHGTVWVFNEFGEPIYRIRSCAGLNTTNVAFGGNANCSLFITDSEACNILRVELDVPGNVLYSHS